MSEEISGYEKELIIEQERVALVTRLLREEIQRLEPEVGELRSQVVDIRNHFWDDVTVNLSNSDDLTETYASMRQQAEVLTEREVSHRYRANLLKGMKRLLPAPYFGRVDFHEDETDISEPFYIGLSSFLHEESDTFYVYDWRTPVASLYYDYPPGPAQYDTPSGIITGTLDLKRQYMIREGSIQSLFDTSVTIGDELLQKALGRSADSQMRSIVATIQQEQNRIIRNVGSRMLIVQGAAGSGKTSAALQRVAYLLYRYRGFLKADQIVLFSPNPMFNSYVASVLPELGEENMQQTTFHEFLEHSLSAFFKLESPFEQMEYVLTSEQEVGFEARLEGIRYKASGAFLQAIHSYKKYLEHEGMIFRDLLFHDRVLISSAQIKAYFYSFESSIRLSNRMELLKEWLENKLIKLELAEREADWVQDELDYLDKDQYQRAYVRTRKQHQ
ncbi:MAG: helicase, partial [Gorillibacterium sp.]|nr:helicase [Gorillibacterium sp.]